MGRFHRHDDDHGRGHGDHSGYATGPERVLVLERILDENERAARANRERLDAARALCLNLTSAPGAGKTTLLERTLRALRGRVRAGVVEGDAGAGIDADRLAGLGAQVSLIDTADGFGGQSHLDAPMVAGALRRLDLHGLDVVFVENVGTLVRPAESDVGAHERVIVCAVTDGEDKPLKYPAMFRSADLVVVNKLDLLPHLDFDLGLFEERLRRVNPHAAVLRISARTEDGLDGWLAWLEDRLERA